MKEGDTLAEIPDRQGRHADGVVRRGGPSPSSTSRRGDDIALGQRVLVLAKKGEDPGQVASQGAGVAKTESVAVRQDFTSQEQTNSPNHPEISVVASNGSGNGHGVPAVSSVGGRVKSSPLARKIATAAKVEIGQIAGSGPGGRVIRSDVESFLSQQACAVGPVEAVDRPRRGEADSSHPDAEGRSPSG